MREVEGWARAEAEKRYPNVKITGGKSYVEARERAAFISGVSALAERLQSPEAIEAAADAVYEAMRGGVSFHRDDIYARAAVAAALDALTKGDNR